MFFLLRMTDPASTSNQGSNQGSNLDLQRQRRREYMKAYYQTPAGKASLEKYRASVKGKKAVARDRKSTRLNSSHVSESRMPSSA